MTAPELQRLRALQRLADGYLTQAAVAGELGLSDRQVRRLLWRFRQLGPRAVVSPKRGRAPNNRLSDELRALILALYLELYEGFGPTLLAQTLLERDHVAVSRESLRALLIEHGLWTGKRRRREQHPIRERRARFGELVQMDGSPHKWFEDRGPHATLLVAIDDASSTVTAARFDEAETTEGYLRLVQAHLHKYGRFEAGYVDKHSIFRLTRPDQDGSTQFHRALEELDIELICANSPQAKGRVERVNRTFQDRLVKALRLAGIATITHANAFLDVFIADHNRRFAIVPASDHDAHRSIERFALADILAIRHERVVTKNRMFQLGDTHYALIDPYSRRNLRQGSRLEIRLRLDGSMAVRCEGHELDAQPVATVNRQPVPIVAAKDLNDHRDRRRLDPKKQRHPAPNHPWRKPLSTRPNRPVPDISALQEPDITALR